MKTFILNLILIILDDIENAYELMKEQESQGAQYSLLKAITYSIKGYEEQSVRKIRQFFDKIMFRLNFLKLPLNFLKPLVNLAQIVIQLRGVSFF